MVQLCRMRYAYHKSRTRVVSCKSNLQHACDCRVRHEECRRLLKHVLRPIYTIRFLLTIVACDFCGARCLRHGKIVYNFHDIKLPVATIVVGF